MNVISTEKHPIKLWANLDEVEPGALTQLKNIANLPFLYRHVAVMPDVHLGVGATIGSVIATQNAISPAAVGVDIGCGMFAIQTNLNAESVFAKRKEVRHEIERLIPTGHHNYVQWEHHFGSNVMVTRKGAVRARVGDMGIIPGSMGTRSYIVKGKGNADSFCSCSHGAGRKMSRTAARKKFTVDDLAAQTDGVECSKAIGILDEIPGAYKDIDQVMEWQKDLVDVVAMLKQMICVKGD